MRQDNVVPFFAALRNSEQVQQRLISVQLEQIKAAIVAMHQAVQQADGELVARRLLSESYGILPRSRAHDYMRRLLELHVVHLVTPSPHADISALLPILKEFVTEYIAVLCEAWAEYDEMDAVRAASEQFGIRPDTHLAEFTLNMLTLIGGIGDEMSTYEPGPDGPA